MLGTKSKVVPKKLIPEMVTDSRFITLKVFEIERSWAFAMKLNSEAYTEPRKRFHMASRLTKAARSADQLADLTSHLNCDAQTMLELQAYIHWIHGIRYFEKKDWPHAKYRLESAQAIYEGLLKIIEKDMRSVYEYRVSELLPRIRYCAHNIGDASAASDLMKMRSSDKELGIEKNIRTTGAKLGVLEQRDLDNLLSQVMASQAQSITEVQWLGHTIPVKLEHARLALNSLKEMDAELAGLTDPVSRLAIHEANLKVCVEAISAVRDELNALTAAELAATAAATTGDIRTLTKPNRSRLMNSNSDQQADLNKLPRIRLLYTYLQYLKLSKTFSRNLIHVEVALSPRMSLVGKESMQTDEINLKTESLNSKKDSSVLIASSSHAKPQELARLYDSLVQTLQEIAAIPGVFQEHRDIDYLQTKLMAYRCFRYVYICDSHG
ncbi:unnamed protein product [Protopolystoma xenopodis]|uniref:Signal recognition particle subunit SRP68 n=1 Tax=Protopolystoma xenopodis TaxID=117903 RepID=A0A3S5CIU1_9PLAT|nr:unnamed protein product [Protopolystoma xenopodis]